MSAVKKTAKFGLYVFSFLVILLVGGAVYLYMNMDSIAKQITEKVASDALGVPVRVGSMAISLQDKKVTVSDLSIANPAGYKKPHAIMIKKIEVAGESFSKELLVFSHIMVDGTNVNLEVSNKGTNLGDIRDNTSSNPSVEKSNKDKSNKASKGENIKVIVKKFSLTGAELNPSVTLLGGDLAKVSVPDIKLYGIGQKENGVLAKDAISQIMNAVLQKFNSSANGAGFLKGMSLDALNNMGVSTAEVFKKNLKDSYKKEVDGLKKNLDGLKGLFE